MNYLTPQDAVNNVLKELHRSIVNEIDHAIDYYGADGETFIKPFTMSTWMQMAPYNKMEFEYEHIKITILQLCNFVEMLHGYAAENDFVRELTKQMKERVEARLMFRREQIAADEQLVMNDELEQAVGSPAA